MKIAVLYGGISGEREVSLSTGREVIKALKKNGHDVLPIDFHPERLHELIPLDVELVFIALHGKFGEDGRIQGFLDMLGIPYVGSGVLASALAMDKDKAKQLFSQHEIPIAKSKAYPTVEKMEIEEIVQDIRTRFSFPFVIKPNREGSTLGISIVDDENMVHEAIEKAFNCDDVILVEDYIAGKEITVPVLGSYGNEKALPIIEIIPKNKFYDYESKYTEGGSEFVIPAPLDEQTTKTIQKYAVYAHQVLGCRTYSRVDFIVQEDNTPIILEVNTLPGMTPTSLFPKSAEKFGLSYEQMIEKLIQLSV